MPHPRWDERPVAIIVPADANADAAQLKQLVLQNFDASKFAKYEVPDDVLCWAEIPMTSTGKLDKKTVRSKLTELGYELPSLAKAKSARCRL
jgi:fatty-acyl-CoA synthase